MKILLSQTKHDEPISQSKPTRTYKRKELSKEMQAINAYYHENKNNEDIIKTVKSKVNEIGYVIKNKKELPIQLIKMECLKRYSEMKKKTQEIYKNEDISNKE